MIVEDKGGIAAIDQQLVAGIGFVGEDGSACGALPLYFAGAGFLDAFDIAQVSCSGGNAAFAIHSLSAGAIGTVAVTNGAESRDSSEPNDIDTFN